MPRLLTLISCFAILTALGTTATQAQRPGFHKGTLIPDFGPVATVPGHMPLPPDTRFRVAFDITAAGDAGGLNRSLESAARFLNMHSEAGVAPSAVQLAVVIHGAAVHDLTKDSVYRKKYGASNANAVLIAALQAHGVEVILCGQSAVARGVSAGDLLPGVKMSLSAMTAHALLQQRGYTLNPF